MSFTYQLTVLCYTFAIRVASILGVKKARLRLKYNTHFRELSDEFDIVIHASSEGEIEQAIPIIKNFQSNNWSILLSIFSPSAIQSAESLKASGSITNWTFQPLDSSRSLLNQYFNKINPKCYIGIKYEFWLNAISILSDKKVKMYWFSVFYKKLPRVFNQVSSLETLKKIHTIYCQDTSTCKLLIQNGFSKHQIQLGSDSRFLRALELKKENLFPGLNSLELVVAGSTWKKDEEFLLNNLETFLLERKLIIFPHEKYYNSFPSEIVWQGEVEELENLIQNSKKKVFVVQTRGVLKYSYKYAQIAYLGGGFGAGIHNTLEAAVHGIPILCGPNLSRFREALLFHKSGQLTIIQHPKNLIHSVDESSLTHSVIEEEQSIAKQAIQNLTTDISAQLTH